MYVTRHFYASLLISKGRDPKEVQKLMGHEDVQLTLQTYGHLWVDAKRDAEIAAGIDQFLTQR